MTDCCSKSEADGVEAGLQLLHLAAVGLELLGEGRLGLGVSRGLLEDGLGVDVGDLVTPPCCWAARRRRTQHRQSHEPGSHDEQLHAQLPMKGAH